MQKYRLRLNLVFYYQKVKGTTKTMDVPDSTSSVNGDKSSPVILREIASPTKPRELNVQMSILAEIAEENPMEAEDDETYVSEKHVGYLSNPTTPTLEDFKGTDVSLSNSVRKKVQVLCFAVYSLLCCQQTPFAWTTVRSVISDL